ncbi:MAG TPA: GlsB/YeaQ/YmgE family stress response membrane protein [Nocardioides sp.]|jgi:uncharacterized membrane protein YeaQ/YmgE (transglycosylase-associated protein family)|nr:GlsB/YeaQ/YmgE family stress response membrane protein [Nocardioides sp.]
MLLIGIILFGMLVGAAAQLLLGTGRAGIDWAMAFSAGIIGSFVGGLLISLLAGDGLELRPSGILGSLAGAVLVTALWLWARGRSTRAGTPHSRSGNPAKRAQDPGRH